MSCDGISKSRLVGCKKNSIGGFKAVGFMPYNSNLQLTSDDMFEGTGLTGSIYRYELVNTGCNYEEDIAPDTQNQNALTTGTLTLVLPQLDRETRNQVKLLAYQKTQIFLELYNGSIILIGHEYGCDATSVKLSTGGAKKDMAGFTLTFLYFS